MHALDPHIGTRLRELSRDSVKRMDRERIFRGYDGEVADLEQRRYAELHYLDITEICQRLHITRPAMYYYIKRKYVTAVYLICGKLFFDEKIVEAECARINHRRGRGR